MFKITTVTGKEYTTEHDILRDRLTQWIPCTDADGNRIEVYLASVETVEEITAAPRKTPKKKVETK